VGRYGSWSILYNTGSWSWQRIGYIAAALVVVRPCKYPAPAAYLDFVSDATADEDPPAPASAAKPDPVKVHISLPQFAASRQKEIAGLLEKGVFQPISRDDVPRGIRIFSSRFVDEIKLPFEHCCRTSRGPTVE
jgi:hypothetical protein